MWCFDSIYFLSNFSSSWSLVASAACCLAAFLFSCLLKYDGLLRCCFGLDAVPSITRRLTDACPACVSATRWAVCPKYINCLNFFTKLSNWTSFAIFVHILNYLNPITGSDAANSTKLKLTNMITRDLLSLLTVHSYWGFIAHLLNFWSCCCFISYVLCT